ncbi:DUF2750 domain-containing protein [Flavobacterium procerum]|uniref:DUF2750 domain-containing protein n=1 Tax=Flavobacterium procerum TaxID=1455569 RepID=A0ABV6BP38_9FLAO
MFKNHIDIKLKHEKFIKKVCETKIVYGLEDDEGFSSSSSVELEDEEGEPIEIICFWSEEKMARVAAKNGWEDYVPAKIDLTDFIENWCIGMDNDGLLVGTNFDQNMFGYEIEGYELILELIEELKKSNDKLEFKKFDSIEDLESQIKEILGQ